MKQYWGLPRVDEGCGEEEETTMARLRPIIKISTCANNNSQGKIMGAYRELVTAEERRIGTRQ